MPRLVAFEFWRIVILLSIVFSTLKLGQVSASAQTAGSSLPPRKQLDVLEQEARKDYANRNYVSAAKIYEQIVSLKPGSPDAWSDLGVCYHLQGRAQEARHSLQRALDLNPNIFSANLILAIDDVQVNKPEEAIPLFERALRIQANNRDAMMGLASARIALQQFELAAGVYRREVELRPEDADAWYGLGLCFEHVAEDTTRRMARFGETSPYTQRMMGEFLTEQGASIDAEQSFTRALASGGDQNGLHASLGFAHLRAGDGVQADKEFNAELQLNPGSLDAKLGLADTAMERDDFAGGGRLLCEVYDEDQAYFLSRLSFILASLDSKTQIKAGSGLRSGHFTEACAPALDTAERELISPGAPEQLKDAFESSATATNSTPIAGSSAVSNAQADMKAGRYSDCFHAIGDQLVHSDSDALLFASCACLSGHFLRGFEQARSVLERHPESMPALYWQAETARKLAQAAFQRSVILRPESWQGHILLGDIFRQRQKWDQAVSHYQAAAQLKPSSPAPYLGLGTVYWQTGQNAQAEASLRDALRLQPDNVLAECELGNIYVREHRFDQAVPLLERALARDPDRITAHADLGQAYASLGRQREAIAELERALAMDRFGDLHYQLYRLHKEQGESRLAQRELIESERLRALELQRHGERTERANEIQRQQLAQPPVKQP